MKTRGNPGDGGRLRPPAADWSIPCERGGMRLGLGLAMGLGLGMLLLLTPRAHAQPWAPQGTGRGEALARQFCQACHLFPDPDLLDRRTWATGTLRRMAPLLGVARLRLEGRPDGEILKEAALFPEEPLLPAQDWTDICNYYLRNAPEEALPQGPREAIGIGLERFRSELVIQSGVEPATSMVRIDAAARQLQLGDARRNALHLLDARGKRMASIPVPSPPVHLSKDGTNTFLTLVGDLFPSDRTTGQVVRLRSIGDQFTLEPVLSGLRRPVECTVADLDGDGFGDLVVSEFGNYLGRLAWHRHSATAGWVPDTLVEYPGAIHTEVLDVDGDGRLDLVALLAQCRDGVYLFRNQGDGTFGWEPLVQFPPVFGVTGFELADMDGDGVPDLVVTNGDNGEYPSPFKRYHGIRIFLNDGTWRFRERWFFPMNGAFRALARDFDGDGDLDLAAISFFADYERSPEESFVYLENRGKLTFTASSPRVATEGRWLTLDAGDLDGDGDLDLVAGAFPDGPRGTPIPAVLEARWQTNRVAAVILRNQTRPDAAASR